MPNAKITHNYEEMHEFVLTGFVQKTWSHVNIKLTESQFAPIVELIP